MANLSLHDLGVASAWLSAIPFAVSGMVAAWLSSGPNGRIAAVGLGALSGVVLMLAVLAANTLFGTAPAGAIGALVVIVLHLLRGARQTHVVALARVGQRALGSYMVLLGGVLLAGWAVRVTGLPDHWRYLGSPAAWLFVASIWFARGLPAHAVKQRTWAAWKQVASVTGLFILLGILMAVSGMAAYLAQALAKTGPAYLAVAPFVGAMGGFVTGSNTGANAMLATTQAEIARTLGVDVLGFMAVHNVAASFLLMASPGKIEMAVQLSPPEAINHRRWVQVAVLWVALAVVAMLAVVNVLIA